MKRGLLGMLSILAIGLVSAVSYSSYNRFSITGFFESINPQDLILMTLFIIVFALINFSLGRVFKDSYGEPNKSLAGIISFSITSLIIYGLWKTGFNIEGLFYGIGISAELLFFIIPIILLVAAVIIFWKLGFNALFTIFGLLIILMTTFTDLIYEKGISLVIGIVLLIIGLWLWRRKVRRARGYAPRGRFGRGTRERGYPDSTRNYGQQRQGGNYMEKARELSAKQRYEQLQRLETQRQSQGVQQQRDQAREGRRQEAKQQKVKDRFIKRFGKRAWRKREKGGNI